MKQELKGNIDKWLSDDEEGNSELNSTFTLDKENTSSQENSRNSNEHSNTRDELKNQCKKWREGLKKKVDIFLLFLFYIVDSSVKSLNRSKA